MRARMSGAPPAGTPTIKCTGRVGYVCALAMRETAGRAAAPAARCRNDLRGSFRFAIASPQGQRPRRVEYSVMMDETFLPADGMFAARRNDRKLGTSRWQLGQNVTSISRVGGRGIAKVFVAGARGRFMARCGAILPDGRGCFRRHTFRACGKVARLLGTHNGLAVRPQISAASIMSLRHLWRNPFNLVVAERGVFLANGDSSPRSWRIGPCLCLIKGLELYHDDARGRWW